jgi:VIT family
MGALGIVTAPAHSPHLRPAILGGADGLVIVLGLVTGLAVSRQSPGAVWHAAVAGGLAELVGMTAGMWLSEGEAGFKVALTCGLAAMGACVVPAVPYAVAGGFAALLASVVLVAVTAAAISWLRPERGFLAVAQTYGILVAAAVLCTAAGLI